MNSQRVAIVLTLINLVILVVTLAYARPAVVDGVVPVLRGRTLEIVDGRGKVRAQILVAPESTMPDGQNYPETALLRLIDPNGRPAVKIGASVDGSGISLDGRPTQQRQWSGIQLLAKPAGNTVKLTNTDGHEKVVQP